MPAIDKINILGVFISAITISEILSFIKIRIQNRHRTVITHVHVMGMNIAYEQAWFRQFLNNSDICYCDGMGVKLASHILGKPLPQRLTLADWMGQFMQLSAQEGFRLFFLGNPPGIAARAAELLVQKYPSLIIAGTHDGFFNKKHDSPENIDVINQINNARADILFVGFGMPVQEKWILENWSKLNPTLVITCGALFEYVAGTLRRGPRWLTSNYLEWLVRMFISPRRYFKRYFRDNPLFLLRLFKHILVNDKRVD